MTRVTRSLIAVLLAGALGASLAATGLAAPRRAATSASTPGASTPPTLGLALYPQDQVGFGSVKPSEINYGGDPTSAVSGVRWSSWGGSRAVGHGSAYWVWPGWCTACGSVRLPATVVAWSLGSCGGHPAYRRVEWFFPTRGEVYDPLLATGDLCTGKSDQRAPAYRPRGCAAQTLPSATGTRGGRAQDIQISGAGLTCARADRFLASSMPMRHFGHNARYESQGWFCGSELAMQAKAVPQSFSCQRGDWLNLSFALVPATK